MSGLLEGMARRAAGLPPAPGIAVASPRPRARFEPGAIGGDRTSIATDAVANTSGERTPGAEAPQSLAPDSRAESLRARVMPSPAHHRAAGADDRALSSESESHEDGPIKSRDSIGQAAHARTQPAEAQARRRGERIGEPAKHDENGEATHAAPLAARDSRSSESAVVETSVSVSRAPAVSDARATLTEITPPRVQATARPEAGMPREPARPREPFRAEPETPRVSVSIGRIEVEIAPPPAPAVAPSRPQPTRTRGFEAYARARRGQPR